MGYEQIVFFQCSEANEPPAILDERGPEAAVEHLARYDEGTHTVSEDLSGAADERFERKERLGRLPSNLELNFIAMAKKPQSRPLAANAGRQRGRIGLVVIGAVSAITFASSTI